MYSGNNNSGTQWFFATIIVITFLALVTGVLFSGAEWLNKSIGQSIANGNNLKNELEYKKGLIELDALQVQAKATEARTLLMLEDQKISIQQWADFRQSFFQTIIVGSMIVFIALGLSLLIFIVTKSIIAYKLAAPHMTTAALLVQADQPRVLPRPRRPRSEAARKAREVELRKLRAKAALKHTTPFYHNASNNITSGDYPWAG